MSTPPAKERVGALIVAAGESLRMQGADKIFAHLGETPLILYALSVFQRSPLIHDIVLVLRAESLTHGRSLLDQYGWGKVRRLCPGGERRQDSVRCGLEDLQGCAWIMVHDGARPCLDHDLVQRGLEAAEETGAAVPVVPISDTIKEVDPQGTVVRTLPRESLGLVQTPQVFRGDLLREAHQKVTTTVTDDAAMVEMLGYRVKAFPGSSTNIKVTTAEDLALAEALLARVGTPAITLDPARQGVT